MTDAEVRATRRRLEALIRRWVPPLGLRDWRLDYEYVREGLRQTDEEVTAGWCTRMDCLATWAYRRAQLRFNLPQVLRLGDAELEETFVHELCHVLINELRERDPTRQHEEHVVSGLAAAFLRVRRAGQADGRRAARRPDGGSRVAPAAPGGAPA